MSTATSWAGASTSVTTLGDAETTPTASATATDRETLILDNLFRVQIIARQMARHGRCEDYEEFYQDGCIGLINAVDRWDGRVKFSTFAEWRIRGAIIDGIRERTRGIHTRTLGRVMTFEEIRDTHRVEASQDDVVLKGEIERICLRAVSRLPEPYRGIVSDYYYGEMKMGEIADERGCTDSHISQLLSKAVPRLQMQLTGVRI